MTFKHVVHHMGKSGDDMRVRIVRTTPIVRLSQFSEVVLLQSGQAWNEDGSVRELPDWAYAAMARLSPACLAEAGFTELPTPPTGRPLAPTILDAGPVMWQCPVCEKVMDDRNKEPHIAKHNKHLGPNDQLAVPASAPMKH